MAGRGRQKFNSQIERSVASKPARYTDHDVFYQTGALLPNRAGRWEPGDSILFRVCRAKPAPSGRSADIRSIAQLDSPPGATDAISFR